MRSNDLTAKHEFRGYWMAAVAVLVLLVHFAPFAAPALDRAFFDEASRHPLARPARVDDSALVLVDDGTMRELGKIGARWPFPRELYAQLFVALYKSGARRIAVDFTFLDASQQDALMGSVCAAIPGLVLSRTKDQGTVFWDASFRAAHPKYFRDIREGLVDIRPDRDGMVRAYSPGGSLAAAAGTPDEEGGLIRWQGGQRQLEQRGLPVLPALPYIVAGRPLLETLLAASPDLEPEPMEKALAEAPPLPPSLSERIRGRTVFVGANASGTFDLKAMPIGGLEPGVLIHWTAWRNAMDHAFITGVPRLLVLALSALVALAIIWRAGGRSGLMATIVGALGAGVLLLGLAYLGLLEGWWIPPATPLATAALTLLGVSLESFWIERRRKAQVEAMFGVYVDRRVVDQLVTDPDYLNLKGERRVATMLFTDLQGFTDLSEKLSSKPEELTEIINAHLDLTSRCLFRHGAYVDKYIGDSVMAVFGVPQELPDHARAACRAAIEALKTLDEVNERYGKPLGVELAVRIGLNSGSITAAMVGSADKKNYTVMGDPVNVASRLEGANKRFGTAILLGESTARPLDDEFATRLLGPVQLKGKNETLDVCELVGFSAELSDGKRRFLACYREGFAAFVARRFDDAIKHFERALSHTSGDRYTSELLAESRRFSLQPPPSDWKYTVEMTSK